MVHRMHITIYNTHWEMFINQNLKLKNKIIFNKIGNIRLFPELASLLSASSRSVGVQSFSELTFYDAYLFPGSLYLQGICS